MSLIAKIYQIDFEELNSISGSSPASEALEKLRIDLEEGYDLLSVQTVDNLAVYIIRNKYRDWTPRFGVQPDRGENK